MLNKLFLKTLFTLSFVLAISSTASATLITQDIWLDSFTTDAIDYEYIGYISIDTENAFTYEVEDTSTGEVSTLGSVSAWVDFDLFGFFEAVFDVNNLGAGIEFLEFDVTENTYNFYAFSGFIDTFTPPGFVDIFDPTGGLYDFGELAFGEARLTAVPAPTSLLLFLGAVIGLTTRRKVK